MGIRNSPKTREFPELAVLRRGRGVRTVGLYRWYALQRRVTPYVFITPFYLLFLLFGVYPFIRALYLSFTRWTGTEEAAFIGLSNYARLLRDERFLQALANTAYYAVGAVYGILPIAFGLALIINSPLVRFKSIFRISSIFPNLTSTVAASIIFILVFNKQYGLLNQLLGLIGIRPIGWLDKELVKIAVLLVAAWRYTGVNALYFLSGLQAIPEELYEAAAVDGADALRRFWYITLPMLKPVALFVVIMAVIGSFQFFAEPQLLAGGGPRNASLTVTMDLYLEGFVNARLGYASAIGYVLAVIIFLLTLIQLRVFGAL